LPAAADSGEAKKADAHDLPRIPTKRLFISVYVANGDGTVSVIDGPVSAPLAITTAALPAAT